MFPFRTHMIWLIFETLLLGEILNFAWFSHRQALNRNRGPMLQNWWEMKEVQIKLLTLTTSLVIRTYLFLPSVFPCIWPLYNDSLSKTMTRWKWHIKQRLWTCVAWQNEVYQDLFTNIEVVIWRWLLRQVWMYIYSPMQFNNSN
jgi:hypothetical protein